MSFINEKYIKIADYSHKFSDKYSKNEPKIVVVTKNRPISSINQAISHGIRCFAENRLQEAITKYGLILKKYPEIELHMTGPMQTNKVKKSLEIFDVFHTLDREKLAKEFVKVGGIENKKFFIQVNTGKEQTKSGIYPEELREFINYCKIDLSLNVIGLMCIPPINDQPKKHFSFLADEAKKNKLSYLSMGMSADYADAINLNANYIRIGTALFGERKNEN